MERNLKTVVAGHLCLDIFPSLEHLKAGEFMSLFQPGYLINVGKATLSTGGPVSNTGLALHILGIPTSLMGKVGDDLFGQTVISLIRARDPGLILGMIIDSATSTSYTVIVNPPGVDRIFLHHTGANDTFSEQDIPYDALADTVLFHFGYPPLMRRMYEKNGEELALIMRNVKQNGVTTSLDMAFPDPSSPSGRVNWREIFKATLPYVDIFTPSLEELLITLHPTEYTRLCEQAGSSQILPCVTPELLNDVSGELLDMGVKIVLIKIGDRGAFLRTASTASLKKMGRCQPGKLSEWNHVELWAPCFQVKLVGAAGSGDSTIAGFLSGLLRGLSPEDTLTMAVAVGGCNVEAVDTLSGLRSWEDTQKRVQQGWSRHSLEITSTGWTWDEIYNLSRKK
jgi:sugar/nucleoside kinase (ribokinase family)